MIVISKKNHWKIFQLLTLNRKSTKAQLLFESPTLPIQPMPRNCNPFMKVSNDDVLLVFFENLKYSQLNKMSDYKNSSATLRNCSMDSPINRTHPCGFDPSLFGDSCSPENEFGFVDFKPCIMLRINKAI